MNRNAPSVVIGSLVLLTIWSVGLKLTDNIDWSWWWVLAPLWASLLLLVITLLVIFILATTAGAADAVRRSKEAEAKRKRDQQ